MQPWEANDIDKVFKNAAENAHFEYDEKAWAAFQGKVVAAEKRSLYYKIGGGAALVTLLAVTAYFYFNTSAPSARSMAEQPSAVSSEVEVTEQLKPSNDGQSNSAQSNDPAVDKAIVETSPSSEPIPENVSPSGQAENPVDPELITSTVDKDLIPAKTQHINTGQSQIIPTEDELTLAENTNYLAPAAPELTEPRASNNLNALLSRKSTLPDSKIQMVTTEMPVSQSEQVEEVIVQRRRTLERLSIGFSVAPDLSGVSFKGNKPGFGIGTSLAYMLNQKFSVGAGVFYAKKLYEIDEGRYGSYNALWQKVQEPNGIDASCHVIEVPVNLRMNLFNRPASNVYLSTGLSTYFMSAEDYVFNYYVEGSDAIDGMNIRGENKHFFSIYNLSIGYQRRLNERFGVEIEPYLKLPIGGVGVWDVNLTSSGTLITARYFFK